MAYNDPNEYYRRNRNETRSYFIDFLLQIIPKKEMSTYNVAELGVGNGANMFLLANYTRFCHGFEASDEACKDIQRQIDIHPHREKLKIENVRLPHRLNNPVRYDILIYGFMGYLLSDDELEKQKSYSLEVLNGTGSYIYIFDFISREKKSRTEEGVSKRTLQFWLEHFSELDLLNFQLFDDCRDNKLIDDLTVVNTNLTSDDNRWMFAALFRKMDKR